MTRRRLAGLVVTGGLVAGLVVGCGIPDHTDVKVDRVGPVSGSNQNSDPEPVPPSRTDADNVEEFVQNFLTAAAGEFDPGGKTDQRVRDYVSGPAPALKNVNLVEVAKIDVRPNNRDVALTVNHLGVLDAEGRISPPDETTTTYQLQVRAEESGGWRLTKVPPETLLDFEALKTYYTERTLYFWNADRNALVPDLRWLPAEVPTSRVPTELLEMIEDGPSPWLGTSASALPGDSKLLANAPIDNDLLTMNWSPAVGNDGQDSLAQQVAWTMRASGLHPRWLQIKINGQARDKLDVNDLLYRTPYPVGPEPHPYAILDGKVSALTVPTGVPAPVPLAAAVNQKLRFAAFKRADDAVDAAIVNQRNELRVGSAGRGAEITDLALVTGVTPRSAPVWLPRSRMGLVAGTDQRLYLFGPDHVARRLAPSGLRDITAVAVAPDGQRIALIADGKVFVVPVSIGQDGVKLLEPRAVIAPLDSPTAVAWSSENALSIGGTESPDRLSITDVTVDSARRTPRVYDARGEISMIAAFPETAALGRTSSTVLYQADNATWLALGTSTQLGRSALVGAAPTQTPGNDQPTQPIAPFFVY
ncbi:LpqB family beta-propeller domain-containing protein [Asanoa siamensis]|uniref:Lipoprotein LpqB n=1 Tax=Asanoa siamensis TaxID=926357 RepID=A0ABQ4D0I2_9ACTN|nr:LpqB family beta-propeller domain-containing protein [Asanoa siamensis]GIF77020.1 lipoprotein LpqB [Asanoa siamensis]